MIPRRLLPYLALFLVLLGLYFGLTWRQSRQEAQKTEAKKIFLVKEGEISELVLKKGKEEIRLAKKDGAWVLLKPIEMRADKATMDSILATLAHMQKERDLEGVADLKAFGLDKPALEVEFTAQGQSRRLVIGNATPGETGHYAYRDQDMGHLLVLNVDIKESLDRPLGALRDKTIFTYAPEQVKSLDLKIAGATAAQLEKTSPGSWSWLGREKFPVRGDRVEELLRFLHGAKVKDFVADAPKGLTSYGLAPPRGEVAVVQQDKEPERLLLGEKGKEGGAYARKAPGGPVVLTDKDLLAQITKTLTTLEDRRLWRGQAAGVQKAVWGPPEKTWAGTKEKDFWKITGPEKQDLKHPAVLMEMGLWKLQALEFARPSSPNPGAKPLYVLELYDGAGKPLFRLEELGREKDQEVLVRVQVGDKTDTGLVAIKTYQDWQKEMAKLAGPSLGPKTAPEKKGKSD
ncbi:MAG: hypothetical protein A3K23_01380 [Desulfobacca sp. RBG_16_58_9]|nr:MAG: hypothetical protein A3K23_01380 [Desulfobacca sp. RBG_16_58_9]